MDCKICEGVKHNEVCEEHKELADNFWEKIEQNRKKANRLDKTLEWVCKEIERVKENGTHTCVSKIDVLEEVKEKLEGK